jgi:bifunctional non-homologous end joining protein LigD
MPGNGGGRGARVRVVVEERMLDLSNLDRELIASSDGSAPFRKAELIDYYRRVAPVLLPHLECRPVSLLRCPDGIDGECFFAKNAPSFTPPWIRTAPLDSPGSSRRRERVNYLVLDEAAALLWVANLAAIELHVPQWRLTADGERGRADRIVIDLDPGPRRDVVDCCRVALLLRDRLGADGLTAYAKTSGSKGLHLYAGLNPTGPERVSQYAHGLARALAAEHPDLVVAVMAKDQRAGKVFLDWSQNNPAKTTVAPYSVRARPGPGVSTPLTWDEVESARSPADLAFTPADVAERVERDGDLLVGLFERRQALPA